MQAAATTPYDGSASDETSTVRLATGLIATSQAADGTATETTCTGFLTGDGRVMISSRCLADPRYVGDQVTVVHNPAGDSSERSRLQPPA